MLHVHRADRADVLVGALGTLLADPQPDPFAPEVVAVPTRGMERWLTQRLSGVLGASSGRADGVCANVDFPSPRRLVGDAVAAASGIDPQRDPWLAERAVWPLLEVIDAAAGEPWLALLAAHLAEGPDEVRGARRFAVARHLADLFDRYAIHRPEMVLAWYAGQEPELWQAELWRRLRARIAVPSLAERLADADGRLREDADVVELPARLALFGLTRIPAGHLAILRALAARRDVHLLLLHPSPALWERVGAALADGLPIARRAEDPTATLPVNRLLATWGRDAREMQVVLAAGAEPVEDHHHPRPPRPAHSLLGLLQAGVSADAAPADPLAPLDPHDRSLRIHACHGRARQVEVLRDALLHLFSDDATLEPRDVIVMCPDIEAFAPLLHATFGAGEAPEDGTEEGPAPPDLRVRLADRSLRQTNPVLGVVGDLLDLAGRRVTASQLLDLADREPVRRRFAFDDDELARIEEWVAASGIRWGLDAAHRAPYKLEGVPAGTWSAGLDRILLGAAMTEDGHRRFGDTLPLDDVDSGSIDLAGRLAELVDRLGAALCAFGARQPIDAWASAIGDAAQALTATARRDAWQHAELERMLADVVDEAAGSQAGLSLAEVRALLARRLEGRPTRANFRTGHLTVCTLVPMRSVPHRVVCLLGLDDEVFPRKSPRDGDDLMLAEPRVGERDARSEDRQLLLDALMSAGEQLIVTYTGKDERTNVSRPPAVPVGELLDVVDRSVAVDEGRPRDRVLVHHPLQPFDPRNFSSGGLEPGRVWGFDPVTLEGARALCAERVQPAPFLAGPLEPAPAAIVEVDQLVRFVQHPVRAFLRQRLGIGVGDYDDELEDALPVELDALAQWGVGDRLLAACLAGTDIEEALAAERSRGSLPPGQLAAGVLGTVRARVERIAGAARSELVHPSASSPGFAGASPRLAAPTGIADASASTHPACTASHDDAIGETTKNFRPDVLGDRHQPSSLDVKVDLGGGRLLSGTVPGAYGDLLVGVTFSRVAPKHRLASWVRWLAITAARPERCFEAAVIGRARYGAKDADVTVARIKPPADRSAFALEQLGVLVDLFDRGMREPLPLACASSAAYAHAAKAGASAKKAATAQWESTWNFDREDKDPEHVLVFGRVLELEELLAQPAREDEAGPGWEGSETSRFGRLARRLWAGPSGVEELTDW